MITCWIRHAYPLSSFLYALIHEPLLWKLAVLTGTVHEVESGRTLSIYTDDVTIVIVPYVHKYD